jgi:hypothetical protein
MEDFVPFGSLPYMLCLAGLVFGRGMDFLSTWMATPNLELEANPIAKKLGWRVGLFLNGVICAIFAVWPLPSIVIITTSVLVAARNFQNAWLMRSMGESAYRFWMGERLREAPRGLFVFCLAAQTVLYLVLGAGLMYFSVIREGTLVIPFGIGMGMITYAVAVFVYSMLSVSRIVRKNT